MPLPVGRGRRAPGKGPPEDSASKVAIGNARTLLWALLILTAIGFGGCGNYEQPSLAAGSSSNSPSAAASFRLAANQSAQAPSSLWATELQKLATQPYAGALCPNAMIPASSDGSPPPFRCITLNFPSTGDAPAKLTRDDLQLLEGNNAVPIQYFAQEPASVGILVDTSGSMESKLPQAREAITQFVNDLNVQDDLFLFAFSSQAFLLQPFTTDHGAVLGRLTLLYAQGETAIYDTLIDGSLMVRHGRFDRKAIFVITDGFDNASKSKKDDALKDARQINVTVYSIGIGNSNKAGSSAWLVRTFSRDTTAVDMQTLNELAEATGGKTYNVPIAGNGDELKNDAAAIAAAISNRYAVGFVTTNAASNSLRLQIRNHPGASVKVEGASITVVNLADTPVSNALSR